MAKKIQLQDANGNVLHPLTLGECVAMDNGENLDTLMSKSQMFTPTITQDKSMFKVGTGVDVDYSANVKDGAYESLVFKGKSLVNLSNLHCSFEDATLSGYYYDTSLCETSKLKLETPYTLMFYTTVHGGDHDIYNSIELGVANSLHSTQAHPHTTTSHRGTLVKNGWSRVCVSFTDFLGYKYLSLRPIRCGVPESGKSIRFSIKGFILLEGDWSNKDLPFNDYFDGIGYAKMPILRNIGKNLLTREYTLNSATLVEETNEYVMTKGSGNIAGGLVFAPNLIPNKTYSFSVTAKTNRTADGAIRVYNDTRKEYINVYLAGLTTQAQKVGGVFTVPSTHQMGDEFKIWIGKNTDYDLETTFTIYKDWQLEESSSITTHEDHKSNILRTSEEIVLREVNGVQDTYNALTGEYVQRIGEIVVTNTVSKSVVVLDNNIRVNIAMSSLNGSNGTTKVNNTLSDKFYWSEANAKDVEGLRVNGNTFHWCVSKNRLTSQDLQGVNTWLQSNPVTIQYELAEPITTIIKPSTMTPFAYQNGHVIVESGFEGQSLLPEIEYSVVTGRTGQVTQNTKVLRQQEQQIIGLEELLLTQVVQMEYERTLLQFDYELQMMMLG